MSDARDPEEDLSGRLHHQLRSGQAVRHAAGATDGPPAEIKTSRFHAPAATSGGRRGADWTAALGSRKRQPRSRGWYGDGAETTTERLRVPLRPRSLAADLLGDRRVLGFRAKGDAARTSATYPRRSQSRSRWRSSLLVHAIASEEVIPAPRTALDGEQQPPRECPNGEEAEALADRRSERLLLANG